MAWHPNRAQWVVIWVAVIAASVLWIQGPFQYDDQNEHAAIAVVVAGGLLVWMLSTKKS